MVGDRQRFIPPIENRTCCESDTRSWHARPCTVNGPQGLGTELVGCAMEDIGAGEEGRVLLGGPEGVRRRHPEAFMGVDFGYRTCCASAPGSSHWQGCGTYFFAEGQTVIKPDVNVMDPWGRARLRIAEDRVSSDRTFENETKLH